jgi:hypothetical protein
MPPAVSYTASLDEDEIYTRKRRSLVIRHASGDRVVAYLEILSPGNKSGRAALERFLDKAVSVLNRSVSTGFLRSARHSWRDLVPVFAFRMAAAGGTATDARRLYRWITAPGIRRTRGHRRTIAADAALLG